MYEECFDEKWPEHFSQLDTSLKDRVAKKIGKILQFPKKRHLKRGARFFVDEVGQYRLVYRVFDETNEVRFYFVGNHKEYEKWYREFF